MRSFNADLLTTLLIPPSLVRTIRLIGEYKGRQDLFQKQSPQVLETLRQAAVIQSTESSNRIEGITAPLERIRKLITGKAKPQNRPEQEIAGYRDVLNTIHANHDHIPFAPGVVLQFHRDLYKFAAERGGRWKPVDNEITETAANGSKAIRFKPLSAFETPQAMERLHERFSFFWASGGIDPLILIPAYVLDFLCVHPFLDGNGRMARLISLLLLYQAGYQVGRFISLEQIVENTRDGYYDSLHRSSQGWHEGRHSLLPWLEYFLGVVLLTAYREFEERVGQVRVHRGAKKEMILSAIQRLPKEFRFADLERSCPGVSRPTINRALSELRRRGRIRCVKPGREATWEKTASHPH
jgi:Fic family protein